MTCSPGTSSPPKAKGDNCGSRVKSSARLRCRTSLTPFAPRLSLDRSQPCQIASPPSDDDGTGLQQRQVQPLADRQIFLVAGAHAGELEAAGRRIEAGVKQGAVALAGTGQDIGRPLEHDDAGSPPR